MELRDRWLPGDNRQSHKIALSLLKILSVVLLLHLADFFEASD